MAASQLKAVVDDYAAVLAKAGAVDDAHGLLVLGKMLSNGSARLVAKRLQEISKFNQSTKGQIATLKDVTPLLEGLLTLLGNAGAKRQVVADLKLIVDVIGQNGELSLADAESAASGSVASASCEIDKMGAVPVDGNSLIEDYLQKLETSLGSDPAFRVVLSSLEADQRIGRTEAADLASRFFGPVAPSTSRPKALQRILLRHQKLLDARAAAATIGGKAA